ncbi:MAG TPA: hypothetical protein VFQ41_23140 [Candidatus Angelobacter sp.]|nr:hypothetical protein [Candidatus Angelobacter sp.]
MKNRVSLEASQISLKNFFRTLATAAFSSPSLSTSLRYNTPSSQWGPEAIRRQLSFALSGAGTVGVEMAGTLAEMSRMALAHDFRHNEPYLHTEPARVTQPQFLKSLIQKSLA